MSNITAFLGRGYPDKEGLGDQWFLWNYAHRRLVVIHTVGLETFTGDDMDVHKKLTPVWLEKIQSLLHTIDFEHGDRRGYLIETPSGPRIIQKAIEPYRIPCDSLWMPHVDMVEIEMSKIWAWDHVIGRGIWRGKEIDVFHAYDDLGLRGIEKTMNAMKALRGMDLTYEIVAHIFAGDVLVGFLTESARMARSMQASDRAAVFAALSKLERAGFVHQGLHDGLRILIDERGKVRFMNLLHIRSYAKHERKKLEEDAQFWHWEMLTNLFDSLGPIPASIPYWFVKPAATILASTPSPERRLLVTLRFEVDMPGADLHDSEAKSKARRKQSSKSARGNWKTLEIGSLRKGHQIPLMMLASLARIKASSPPPPYTKYPVENVSLMSRVMLAEEHATTASVVELVD
ncbi:hypothetical protein C8F04DRAFT_1075388 [Mycena alexandri]|uniref:Uncharacterized protein n=1 Tax=Mycena alexandri TaxID=1745969 RepID=A0AAD6TD98_9AGAR|nr:hypothetical protein C8F04DRAFT_1075388 [Mycena alexandri]